MEDISGLKFYNLTAVRPTDKRRSGGIVWIWKCECGKEIESRKALVKSGHTKSCGCWRNRNADVRKVCRHCGEISNRRGVSGNFLAVCTPCAEKQCIKSVENYPVKRMVYAAKVRAKKANVPFALTDKDIAIPKFCPILGIKLEYGSMNERDSSPSIDRLHPELGYVPENIAVISHRANRIKNSGTAEQHRKIAAWMDSFGTPQQILGEI